MRRTASVKIHRERAERIDWRTLAAIAAALAFGLILPVSRARATGENSAASSYVTAAPDPAMPGKSFKGKLPITDLSEDEAILHALNRLAYGPRPGDVETVRKMGLEKWIEEQLHPESIDDSALDTRLEQYPTLKMSSKKLLDEFPPPQQAAKKEGVTKEEYEQQMKEKAREAAAQVQTTGPNAQAAAQLAKIQGPQRIVSGTLDGQARPRDLQPTAA